MIKYLPQQIFGFDNFNRRLKKIQDSGLDEKGKNSAFSMMMHDLLYILEQEEEQVLLDKRLDTIIEGQLADLEKSNGV